MLIIIILLILVVSSLSSIDNNRNRNININKNKIVTNTNTNSDSAMIPSNYLKYPHRYIYDTARYIIRYFHFYYTRLGKNFNNPTNSTYTYTKVWPYFTKYNNDTNDITIDNNLSYYGKKLSIAEIEGLKELKRMRLKSIKSLKHLKWLESVKDIELLRFLKMKKGNVNNAWTMIVNHAKWRISKSGPDGNKLGFHPELHKQVFWLGLSKEKKPTLVIKTHFHDGFYYNEDPKVFTAFIVKIIEEGRSKYGIGQTTRARLILDRATLPTHRTVRPNVKKLSDVEILKNLIEVYKSLYTTIIDNYPDILEIAQIAPASIIFSAFYKIVGRIMDEETRNKFVMVTSKDIKKLILNQYDPKQFPKHFGGYSDDYISSKNNLLKFY